MAGIRRLLGRNPGIIIRAIASFPRFCLDPARRVPVPRKKDLDWFGKSGASMIFPDYWKEFTEIIPAPEKDDLISAYHARVHGADRKIRVSGCPGLDQNGRDESVTGTMLPSCESYTPGNVDKTVT